MSDGGVPLRRRVVHTALGDVVVRTRSGDGKIATVLLHGAAGSSSTWRPLIDADESLTDIVALDLPGWGESGRLDRHASIASMTRTIAHVVTSLGYSRWHVVGHSLGGHLALDLAASMPRQTESVTLVSATGSGTVTVLRHPVRGMTRLPWLVGMLVAMRLLAALGATGRLLLRVLDRTGALRGLVAPLFAARPTDAPALTVWASEVRPVSFLRAVAAARRCDERAWSGIRCPVLSITGEQDVFVDSSDAAWFARHLPSVTSVVVPGAGHFAHVERPAQVLALIASSRRSRIALPREANSR